MLSRIHCLHVQAAGFAVSPFFDFMWFFIWIEHILPKATVIMQAPSKNDPISDNRATIGEGMVTYCAGTGEKRVPVGTKDNPIVVDDSDGPPLSRYATLGPNNTLASSTSISLQFRGRYIYLTGPLNGDDS